MGTLVLALLALPALAADARFTDTLWTSIRPIYAKTLEHPFLKGLADGTLPRARFQFYLIQDVKYLRAFGQALSVLARRALGALTRRPYCCCGAAVEAVAPSIFSILARSCFTESMSGALGANFT